MSSSFSFDVNVEIVIEFIFSVFFSLTHTARATSLSLAPPRAMASPIPSELLPALDALYAAPASVSSSSSPPSNEADHRRAAERWLVAFQSSDAAWQVRKRRRSFAPIDRTMASSLSSLALRRIKMDRKRREGEEKRSQKGSRFLLFSIAMDTSKGRPFLIPSTSTPPLTKNPKSPGLARPALVLLDGPGARPRLRGADPALEVLGEGAE
jgi:hypothetical protein